MRSRMLVDAHCHLERETYGDELVAVIERARAAGITRFVAVGAARVLGGASEVVELAARWPWIYAAVGLHPHDADKASPADEEALLALLSRPKVVALGEIGLDYHYDHAAGRTQRALFARLLAAGRRLEVAVMLHVREAHEDTLAIIDDVGLSSRGGVVHCFGGGPAEAEAYLARGFMLSIPGVITFKGAEALREAVRVVPLDRLLVETDCPYLAPVPYRGKRNEPAYITATVAALAAAKGLAAEEVAAATYANAVRFFRLEDAHV